MAARSSEKGNAVKIDVRVLITEEDGIFNATCLEMGLAAAGPDFEMVKRDVVELIDAHVRACREENRPDDVFVPAPPEYWRRYAEAVAASTCRQVKLPMPSVHRNPKDVASCVDVSGYVCA